MRKIIMIAAGALIAGTLIACGTGGSDKNVGTSVDAGVEVTASAPANMVAKMGGPEGRSFDNGLVVILGAPKKGTPPKYSYGHEQGNVFAEFTVTIKNGGTNPYDIGAAYLSSSMGKIGTQGEQVFGGKLGLAEGTIPPGGTKTFTAGFSYPTKDATRVDVTVDLNTMDGAKALFTGGPVR